MAKRRHSRERKKMRQRQQQAKRRRPEQARGKRPFPDPRLLTFQITEIDSVPVTEDTFGFPVDRMRLTDGRVLAWHVPLVPAFYLMTAKALRDDGERERAQVMKTIIAAPERVEYADVNVKDDSLAMDALGKLGSAVILSAAAVEAYANEAIDRLDEKETVEVERRGAKQTVSQPEMVRRLSVEEKLDLVLPKVTGKKSIKGRGPWPRFKKLNELRGEVVHVKPRGQTDDPDVPSILGRLLNGEGSTCVEDAVAIITAYEDTALPESTRKALGL
jgi:hypothetical protein